MTAIEQPIALSEPTIDEIDEPTSSRKGPGGKHDNMRTYSPEEAALVFKLVEQHAPRWTHIAKLVSDATKQPRTAASIRNYYKRFCASKAIAERDSAVRKLNRCQMCGAIKRGHICAGTKSLEYDVPAGDAPANPAPAAAAPKVLALSAKDTSLPPLANASLAIDQTGLGSGLYLGSGASPLFTPGGLSTPGPVSLTGFLGIADLPTPAALAAAGAPFAAAAYTNPFRVPSVPPPEPVLDGKELMTEADMAEVDEEMTTDGGEKTRSATPIAEAAVEVSA